MNGLDKIKAEINAEASGRAQKINQEAMHTAEKVARDADEKMEAWKEEFSQKLETECKIIEERGASANRQARKQALLEVRSGVISDAIAQAKSQIEGLPTKDYFNLMLSLFRQNSRELDGEISFSVEDSTRVPSDFIDKCKATLKTGSIEICDSTNTIKNGFLLIYGKTEQNCSIDSIFDSNKNLFRDEVNNRLILATKAV